MPSAADEQDLLRRCLDGSATADDYDRAERLLAEDPQLAASLREDAALDALITTALRAANTHTFARTITARVRDQGNSRRFARNMRRRVEANARRPLRLPHWSWLTAAAVVVAMISTWLLTAQPSAELPAVAQVHDVDGAITLIRSDSRLSVTEGLSLARGDTIDIATSDTARIHMNDGSEIHLRGPARLVLTGTANLHLHHGTADFDVSPRTVEPFAVTTPQARIEVLGTRFETAVDDERTAVNVDEGRVRLFDRQDWSLRTIAEGTAASTP
jgi:hypothetical protein